MNNPFGKDESIKLKAVAILMMMFHHCFLQDRATGYLIDYYPLNAIQVGNIAAFFKICVSIFVFISGYGLYLSYKRNEGIVGKWILMRYIKTFSVYWLVFVLSFLVSFFIDRLPVESYGYNESIYAGIFYTIIDFLGFSNLCGRTPMNPTWWYMSAALLFIVLTPILGWLMTSFGSIVTLLLCIIVPRVFIDGYPGGINGISFIVAFCMGMIFAKENIWGKLQIRFNNKKCNMEYIFYCPF